MKINHNKNTEGCVGPEPCQYCAARRRKFQRNASELYKNKGGLFDRRNLLEVKDGNNSNNTTR